LYRLESNRRFNSGRSHHFPTIPNDRFPKQSALAKRQPAAVGAPDDFGRELLGFKLATCLAGAVAKPTGKSRTHALVKLPDSGSQRTADKEAA
jgi:hypothetical protein